MSLLVGCGYWGKNIGSTLLSLSDLIGVCDLVDVNLERFQKNHSDANKYGGYSTSTPDGKSQVGPSNDNEKRNEKGRVSPN